MSQFPFNFTIIKSLIDLNSVKLLLNQKHIWNKKLSSTRNININWNGIINISDIDLKHYSFVELPDGRIDINLPNELSNKMTSDFQNNILKYFPADYKIQYINLLINPPNKNMQNWHQDNGGLQKHEYYTVLIPLTHSQGMGKTEVIDSCHKSFPKKYKILIPDINIGDALVFSGSLWHRGTPNLSNHTRYCLYMIVSNQDKSLLFEAW